MANLLIPKSVASLVKKIPLRASSFSTLRGTISNYTKNKSTLFKEVYSAVISAPLASRPNNVTIARKTATISTVAASTPP